VEPQETSEHRATDKRGTSFQADGRYSRFGSLFDTPSLLACISEWGFVTIEDERTERSNFHYTAVSFLREHLTRTRRLSEKVIYFQDSRTNRSDRAAVQRRLSEQIFAFANNITHEGGTHLIGQSRYAHPNNYAVSTIFQGLKDNLSGDDVRVCVRHRVKPSASVRRSNED
jgi:DNA gyrase/topoisomerase IV subunit B